MYQTNIFSVESVGIRFFYDFIWHESKAGQCGTNLSGMASGYSSTIFIGVEQGSIDLATDLRLLSGQNKSKQTCYLVVLFINQSFRDQMMLL